MDLPSSGSARLATGSGRLATGLGLPFRAISYLAEHPALLWYALLPVIVTAGAFAVALVAGGPLSGWLLGLLWTRPEGWLLGLWQVVRGGLWLGLTLGLGFALAVIASAPFADQLSARVEALELGEPQGGGLSRVLAETWRGLANSVVRSIGLLLWLALLLPAMFVPFAYPVLAFLVTARWTAIQWLDLPMARNLHRVRDVKAALAAVRPLGFGWGGVLTLALAIPFADFLVVPLGAVSGTLLFCDLVRAGVVPRAPGRRESLGVRPPPVGGRSPPPPAPPAAPGSAA